MIADLSIHSLQLMFCTGFIIVLCENLNSIDDSHSVFFYAWAIFPLLTLLSWIPNIGDLWFTSFLGIFIYLFGVIGLTYIDSFKDFNPISDYDKMKVLGMAETFGVALYSMEAITLTIPVADSLKRPKQAKMIVFATICGWLVCCVPFAAVGYIAGYGDCDIITDCLDKGPLTDVMRFFLAIALILTHPVFLIVTSECLEEILLTPSSSSEGREEDGDEMDVSLLDREEGQQSREQLQEQHVHVNNTTQPSSSIFKPSKQDGDYRLLSSSPSSSPSSSKMEEEDEDSDQLSEHEDEQLHSLSSTLHYLTCLCTLDPFVWKQRAIRTVCVAFTCFVASLHPDFSIFSSLVGSVLITIVAFFFPVAMYLKLHMTPATEDKPASFEEISWGMWLVLIAVAFMGLVSMVVGTYSGFEQLLDE